MYSGMTSTLGIALAATGFARCSDTIGRSTGPLSLLLRRFIAMRHSRAALTLMFGVFLSSAALAQSTSFAGKWAIVPDPAAQAPMGGLGESALIKQDATTLTITRTTPMGELTSVYKLDGSESKNTLSFQGNSIDQTSKAKWDGGTLHVDTAMNFDGNQVNVTMAMSLDPSGTLVVVSTRPDFQGGGAPVTTKTSYKKVE